MSYESQVDELVGEHVARFQAELTLARQLRDRTGKAAPMPYGYPVGVYHPHHICRVPRFRAFIARTGGCLSNGVPRVLRTEWHQGSLLGIYNPCQG